MKRIPTDNDIWTRVGKIMNPLNVQNEDVSIIDVVHAMPINAMYGGMSRKFYSFAEHSVNMYDYFDAYMDEVVEKFDKPETKKKRSENSEKRFVSDVKKRHLKLFTLLYYAPRPYLRAVEGGFESYSYHYARVAAAIINNIGLNYEDFKLCKPMLDYIDKEVNMSVYPSFNSVGDKYLFLQPQKAQEEYISRFNRDSDIEVKILGQGFAVVVPDFNPNGQAVMNFNLPTVSI
jgi:hypothetical protein